MRRGLLGLSVLTATLLIACGGGDGDSTPPPAESSAPEQTQADRSAADVAEPADTSADPATEDAALREYLIAVDAAVGTVGAEIEALVGPELEEAALAAEESGDATEYARLLSRFFADQRPVLIALVDALDALERPAGASVDPQPFQEALRAAVLALDGVSEALQGAATFDEIDAATAPLDDLDALIVPACEALQRIADANSIDVDLCGLFGE